MSVQDIKHLFNPNKMLNDFPEVVEAFFPKGPPFARYQISRTGKLVNVDSGRIAIIQSVPDKSATFNYTRTNEQRKNVVGKIRVKDLMVYSFFRGFYSPNSELINVLHHDRKPANLAIHNLVPIFTLQQLQSYFIYRLEMIEGEKFRVAVSKYPDEYTLDNYLVGIRGTTFALHKKVFMKSSSSRYAMYFIYPTFKEANNGGNTRYIQGHILVAATFVGPIPPGYHVHHIDGHPRNNDAPNLQILSARDHMRLHTDNFRKEQDNKELTSTCSICLVEDEEATWCPCQKAYCTLHIKEHEESCWYHEHDKDAEYNRFIPLILDGKHVPNYEINKKAQIKHMDSTNLRSVAFNKGYAVIQLSKKTTTQFVHVIMRDTFLQGQLPAKNGVIDHLNSNRRLNHIKNLLPTTQKINIIHAHGAHVVVKYKKTDEMAHYDCIDDCAGVFADIYPKIKSQLIRAEKIVDHASHIFYRGPKRKFEFDKFYE